MLPSDSGVPIAKYPVHGYAEGVGVVGRVANAIAYGTVSGDLKRDVVVVLHELAHLLGAEHSNKGIMTTERPDYRRGFSFSDRSLREMHTDRSRSFQSELSLPRKQVETALPNRGGFQSSHSQSN
jgi:hypothetical protein